MTLATFHILRFYHFRWFSKCVFVRLVKGDEFIAKCLAERPPEKVEINLGTLKPGFFTSSIFQVVAGGNVGRQVTEEEVRRAMSQAIVRQVLYQSFSIDLN